MVTKVEPKFFIHVYLIFKEASINGDHRTINTQTHEQEIIVQLLSNNDDKKLEFTNLLRMISKTENAFWLRVEL